MNNPEFPTAGLLGARSAGIIGAGVAGLCTARTLMAQGVQCTVFEREAELGGVWAAGYYGFGVQIQKELYEFPDWPLPPETRDFTPGREIQQYLTGYAEHFGIMPQIRFESAVTALTRNPDSDHGWIISYEDQSGNHDEAFDIVVVAIGLYSNIPNVPSFPDQQLFAGEIIHNSKFQSPDQLKGHKVVVVGLGKSATDAAVDSARVATSTTVVFRTAHWPVPRKLAGILPFKFGMLHRLTSTLLPLYYRPSRLERVVHTLGFPLVWGFWRLVELLLRFQLKLGSRFGTRQSLVPREPVERGAFAEAIMVPRPEFYPWIRSGRIQIRKSEIARFRPNSIELENGEELEADLVILGTGWKSDYSFLSEPIRDSLGMEGDGFYLYRQILHPDVPGLVFIGHASTVGNMLTYSLQARWLGELIAGHHQLPARDAMLENISEMKSWKRKTMPHSGARSARLILHMLHYHDELLHDFGANTRRKTGLLAPLKEIFSPYEPSDYGSIVTGTWKT